jgi:hypothetical protein
VHDSAWSKDLTVEVAGHGVVSHRVRDATRKTIIKVAAKSAMLELDPDGRLPAATHADRMAIALQAFAERARDMVRDAVGEARERLQILDGATQLRVLVRMADHDYFWASVDQPLADRFAEPAQRPDHGGTVGSAAPRDRLGPCAGRQPLRPDAFADPGYPFRRPD